MWPFNRVSDAEYIERLRRSLAKFQRFRRWLILGYAVLTVGFIGALVIIVALLRAIFQQNNLPDALVGLAIGFVFGFMLGSVALKLGHGLATTILDRRAERLLVKYHDTVQAALRSDEATRDAASDAQAALQRRC
jgi:hypothetical protein